MEHHHPYYLQERIGDQDHTNNSRNISTHRHPHTDGAAGGDGGHHKNVKGSWTDVGEPHDSGHFTVTPELEIASGGSGCSGSSGGQSPTTFLFNSNENPPHSAALVLKTCREQQTKKGNSSNNSTSSLPAKYAYSHPPHNTSYSSESCKYKGEDEGDDNCMSSSSSPSVSYLKTALENFNALYQEKLQMIEDVGAQGDTAKKQSLVEKKAQILECWAKDVCVQNIVLIHTVEELERQGEDKMRTLKQKINESSNLSKRHKVVVESYEERIQALLKERAASHETHKGLKLDLDKIKTEYKRIHGRINRYEKDNDSLVTLITRIRDMGVWDIDGLEFQRRTFAQMFELYPHLPGSEVHTVFTREKARHIRETEDTVEKLESKVSELEDFQSKACHMIETKDSTISELEVEMNRIVEKLQQCQEECDHYKKSLIETQEKLLQTSKELQIRAKVPSRPDTASDADSVRHAEIQELLQELRIVKDRLNSSVKESQSAKEETNLIRKEFSDRLRAMQESQQCLQSELTHSFDTHHLVQEKQVELDKVKEEIHICQAKCETTEMQLDKKDKIIEEMQTTIKQLNNKQNTVYESGHASQNVLLSHKNFISTLLKCGRDRTENTAAPKKNTQQIAGRKPDWSDNFVKCNILDNPSNSTIISQKKSTLGSTKLKSTRTDWDHNSKNDSFTTTNSSCKPNRHNGQNFVSLNRNKLSLCSCAGYQPELVSDLFDSPCYTQNSNSANCSTLKGDPALKNETKWEASPTKCTTNYKKIIDEKSLKMDPTLAPRQKENSSPPKIDNPLAHTYELLREVAVKASKNIITSEVPKNVSCIKVVAGHSSHHKKKVNSHSHTTAYKPQANMDLDIINNKLDNSRVNLTVPFPQPHLSKSLEELLAELPEQTYANVVHEWIQSSSPHPSNNVTPSTKFDNPILRKKVIPKPNSAQKKPLLRLASQKNALISSSKIYADKSRQIEKDIIDIKEEWNRIFSNSDQPSENDQLISDPVLVAKSPKDDRAGISSSVEQTAIADKQQQQFIQHFEMEKSKLTEDFLKQLGDKDIEITMQKDCFGNDAKCEAMSMWELVNAFDDFKVDAHRQLDELRNVNHTLSTKLLGMKSKLQHFNQLVKIKNLSEESFKPSPTAASSTERRTFGHFARQIKQFITESGESLKRIEGMQIILQRMEGFGPATKDEIRKMELELQFLERINCQLQSKLEISNSDVLRLTEETDVLRQEKEKAEEEMLSAKIELQSIREANLCQDFPTNIKASLDQMKRAYEKSEEINESKNAEIAGKDILIKQYKNYCKKSKQYLDRKSYAEAHFWSIKEERDQLISEKAQALSVKHELSKTVTLLEHKLIACETETVQLKHSLQWYINQVERVEKLHSTWLRTLPGAVISDCEKVCKKPKSQSNNPRTFDTGSGDCVTKNNSEPNLKRIEDFR